MKTISFQLLGALVLSCGVGVAQQAPTQPKAESPSSAPGAGASPQVPFVAQDGKKPLSPDDLPASAEKPKSPVIAGGGGLVANPKFQPPPSPKGSVAPPDAGSVPAPSRIRDTAVPDAARREDFANALSGEWEVPADAFDFIPPTLRDEVRGYVEKITTLLVAGDQTAVEAYLADHREEIAEVFDQLGLAPTGEGLLASKPQPLVIGPKGEALYALDPSKLKFPGQNQDFTKFVKDLKLPAWEEDYYLRSHELATALRSRLAQVGQDQAKIDEVVDKYYQELEALNEKYDDLARQSVLDRLEEVGPDGGRPDPTE